jgi:hypothetical protein
MISRQGKMKPSFVLQWKIVQPHSTKIEIVLCQIFTYNNSLFVK